MPGNALMGAEEARVFTAIGRLENQISDLSERLEALQTASRDEHREVHNIVVATSEAVRLLTRLVDDLRPHVESYKMKAEKLDEAIAAARDYRVEQAEERGAQKYKNWIYGLFASAGGIVALLLGKLLDWVLARPHVPVVVALASLALIASVARALSQEHRSHPAADQPLHEQFYSTWYMPDDPSKSCCSKADCYPTQIRYIAGVLHAQRREDGHWLPIPAAKIERRRDNPDGRNHLCAPPPNVTYPPETVFCFTLGGGT